MDQRKQRANDVTCVRRTSGQPADMAAYERRADVMAAILEVWCQLKIRLCHAINEYINLKNNPAAKFHLEPI